VWKLICAFTGKNSNIAETRKIVRKAQSGWSIRGKKPKRVRRAAKLDCGRKKKKPQGAHHGQAEPKGPKENKPTSNTPSWGKGEKELEKEGGPKAVRYQEGAGREWGGGCRKRSRSSKLPKAKGSSVLGKNIGTKNTFRPSQ